MVHFLEGFAAIAVLVIAILVVGLFKGRDALAKAQENKTDAEADILTCNRAKDAAKAGILTCNHDKGKAEAELATCNNDKGKAEAELATCNNAMHNAGEDRRRELEYSQSHELR